MPEPLMTLVETWEHDKWRAKDSSGLRTGAWECKPKCHRCQMGAALKAWAAAIPNNADGLYTDNELTEFCFFHKDILGVRDE